MTTSQQAWDLAHAASTKPAEQLARLNRWLQRRDTDRGLLDAGGDLRAAFEAAWLEQEQRPPVPRTPGEQQWCAWLWAFTRVLDWSFCPISIRDRLRRIRDRHGVPHTDDFLEVSVMELMAEGWSTKEACVESVRRLRQREMPRLIAEDVAERTKERDKASRIEAHRRMRRAVKPETAEAWLRASGASQAAAAGDAEAQRIYMQALDVLHTDPAVNEGDDFWELVTAMAEWAPPLAQEAAS